MFFFGISVLVITWFFIVHMYLYYLYVPAVYLLLIYLKQIISKNRKPTMKAYDQEDYVSQNIMSVQSQWASVLIEFLWGK